MTVERPPSEFFYPRHYAFRLGHYDLYGVEDLLTYAMENLPLAQIMIGEIEKVSSNNMKNRSYLYILSMFTRNIMLIISVLDFKYAIMNFPGKIWELHGTYFLFYLISSFFVPCMFFLHRGFRLKKLMVRF